MSSTASTNKASKADPTQKYWIGFDLGGTKMLALVLDENYQVLGSARKSTGGAEGAAKGRERILQVIHEAMEDAGVKPDGLSGIGMGCPGLVNPDLGILLNAPNLGWSKMKLREHLQEHFGRVPVMVLNDVDAGTYGEFKLGAGRGARSLFGVFPGTGLGAGYVFNGELIQGKGLSAMELGMVYLPGTHVGSTKMGAVMLEDLTSRLSIAAQGSVECHRGRAAALQKKSEGRLENIKSKAIANSYAAKDPGMQVILDNALQYLGMGVAIVVNLLAPDRIVLGGGLVEEMPQLYLKKLREYVNLYALPALAEGLEYVVAEVGGNAVAVGAVAWLRHRHQTAEVGHEA